MTKAPEAVYICHNKSRILECIQQGYIAYVDNSCWQLCLHGAVIELFCVFQPSNIFFAMNGSVKIGDFGLVTAIEENCCDICYNGIQSPVLPDGRHTDQVGTKLYMSPEQVSSVCCVCYF